MVAVKRILFVCTGNICRSPTAEAVARSMAAARGRDADFVFDSAGIEGYHVGEPPDRRATARGGLRGYDLAPLRARRVVADDFETFDLVLAMDRDHLRALTRMCPAPLRHKVQMFRRDGDADVPDPYYGTVEDFDHVLDICEDTVPLLFE